MRSQSESADREPVTRPWPVSFVEMNSYNVMESSEISQVFISRNQSACEQAQGAEAEGHATWYFESLTWGVSSGFL